MWSGNLISGNEDIINNLLKKLEIWLLNDLHG
jgi:hypothetical protein